MKTSLEELDAITPHEVDQAMFPRDPPRPGPGGFIGLGQGAALIGRASM
jgi:hypothetical protein